MKVCGWREIRLHVVRRPLLGNVRAQAVGRRRLPREPEAASRILRDRSRKTSFGRRCCSVGDRWALSTAAHSARVVCSSARWRGGSADVAGDEDCTGR
jgi:hypothetical protein